MSTVLTNPGSVSEVFLTFLRLGCSSFGGPIAHLGYFRREFVERRRWVQETEFAQLISLGQFLPGPASSQVGFLVGLLRAGWLGGLAAFLAFTFPSAVLLFLFAALVPKFGGEVGSAAVQGLKLVALAVVAYGVLGMARRLCPDGARSTIATLTCVLVLLSDQAWIQPVVVVLGGLIGFTILSGTLESHRLDLSPRYGRRVGALLIAIFLALLILVPVVGSQSPDLPSISSAFYRAGALVFGGGHVVLPLLEEMVVAPGWVSQSEFLAGYGAAQSVPGPMFSLSVYLGARITASRSPLSGAMVALTSIFLPGFLLASGILPFWSAVTKHPAASRAVAGINAAVVGLLGAALYDPLWTSAIRQPHDLAIALVGFTLLTAWRASAIAVVAWCVLASVVLELWM